MTWTDGKATSRQIAYMALLLGDIDMPDTELLTWIRDHLDMEFDATEDITKTEAIRIIDRIKKDDFTN